ncbi:MAG: hypothetical protein FWC03_12505 [Treponema sp.]|nr:hypothetical protein [Treponema sp.]
MDLPNPNQALYTCAVNCILNRRNGKCKNQWDSMACNDCRLYIKRYIDVDPMQAELYMIQAQDQVELDYPRFRLINPLSIFIVLSIAAIVGWWHYSNYLTDKRIADYRLEQQGKQVQQTQQQSANIVPALNTTMQYVYAAMDNVERRLHAEEDINHDGLVNCIDAAIFFYQVYPVKSDVAIIVNRNTVTGFHHLFNSVNFNGTWRAIEPQARYSRQNSIWMEDVWPNKYNAALNRVVTDEYLRYSR